MFRDLHPTTARWLAGVLLIGMAMGSLWGTFHVLDELHARTPDRLPVAAVDAETGFGLPGAGPVDRR